LPPLQLQANRLKVSSMLRMATVESAHSDPTHREPAALDLRGGTSR
jgi:hypothetical protein